MLKLSRGFRNLYRLRNFSSEVPKEEATEPVTTDQAFPILEESVEDMSTIFFQ
jgi:hypothetical protein